MVALSTDTIPPIQLINNVNGYSQAMESLPKVVTTFYSVIHRVHSLWRRYRKASLYANPDTLLKMIGGHFLYMIVHNKKVEDYIGVAAQCILLVERITACIKSLIELQKAYKFLKKAWKTEIPLQLREPYRLNMFPYVLSATTEMKYFSYIDKLKLRVRALAYMCFLLIKEVFLLSMRTLDAVEAFHVTPERRAEATRELFVNGGALCSLLKGKEESEDYQDQLVCLLKNHQDILDNIFSQLDKNKKDNVSYTNSLIELLQKCVHTIRQPKTLFEKGKIILNVVKKELGFSMISKEVELLQSETKYTVCEIYLDA